jgi:hypothetical protein
MSLRLDDLVVAPPGALLALTILGLASGCSKQGHSGEACEADAGALYPTYSCNAGLVCNTGQPTPTCETPNEQASGGACGDDDNCQSGLYCSVARTCDPLIAEGAACPDETGCGPGLQCANVPMPTCVTLDASLVASMDATVAAQDAGGDASETGGDGSAATADGSSGPGDTACGASDDAGEHAGPCADGGMCCSGGAVGTFYCYTGESGTCPDVP